MQDTRDIPGFNVTEMDYLGYDFRYEIKDLPEDELNNFFNILNQKKKFKGKLNLEDTIRTAIAIGKGKELQYSVASQFNYAIGLLTFVGIGSYIAFNNIDKDNLSSLKNLCLIGIPAYLLFGGIGHALSSFYIKHKVNSVIDNDEDQ
ncbi:hypothetical protein HY498_03120 [Candidatus Woesearchaeota archaeon]|nr:hypothetical protein [Candidatus Woesearchaeota archaeon]